MTIDKTHMSGILVAETCLSEEQQGRLLSRLNDINKADPLEYRRQALRNSPSTPEGVISIDDVRAIAELQDVLYDPAFVSHRAFLGRFIIGYKRLLHKFFKKWLGISLARQFELNQRIFNLSLAVHILENRLQRLENLAKDRV